MKIRLSLIITLVMVLVSFSTSYSQDTGALREILMDIDPDRRPAVTLDNLAEDGFLFQGIELGTLRPAARSGNCVYSGNEWTGQGFKSGGSSGDDVPDSFNNATFVYPHEVVIRPEAPSERTAIIVVDNFLGEQVYDVPHGQLIVAHMTDILTEGNGGFEFLQDSPIYAVDSRNWNTEVMADRMTEAIAHIYLDSTGEGEPITRFVFNLSFSMIPCIIAADFEASQLGSFDAYLEALLATNNLGEDDFSDIQDFRQRLINLLANPLQQITTDPMRNLFGDVCQYATTDYKFRSTSVPPIFIMESDGDSPTLTPTAISDTINSSTVGSAFEEQGQLCSQNRIPIVAYVGASGNFGEPFPFFPAAFPEILSVGATIANPGGGGERWEYSNDGEVFSPGAYFTLPFLEDDGFQEDAYFGTSFAAPNIALQIASRIDDVQPMMFEISQPDGTTQDFPPTFEWSIPPGDVDAYIVSVKRANTDDEPQRFSVLPDQCGGDSTTCTTQLEGFNPLFNQQYTWRAQAINNGVGSPLSEAKTFTVVDVPPTVNTFTPMISVSGSTPTVNLAITFSEPVNISDSVAAVSVTCDSYTQPFTLSGQLSNRTSVSFTIPNPQLWDDCTMTLTATQITDNTANPLDGDDNGVGGDDFQQDFSIDNPYDVNDDRIVSPADAVFVTNRIGQPLTNMNAAANVDGDTDIDEDDLNAVLAQLGTSAAP